MIRQGTNLQQEFIAKYNELHHNLQELSKPYFERLSNGEVTDKYVSKEEAKEVLNNNFIQFMRAVHVLKNENPFISKKLSDFYKINDLRNVIVHEFKNDKNNGYKIVEIAEPTEYAMNLISDTIEKLTKPITVNEYLLRKEKRDVKYVLENDSVYKLFSFVDNNKYTQFPVFDTQENFKGIISDNGLAYWITSAALKEKEFGTIEISDVTIKELLSLDEERQSFKIITIDDYLYDVLSYFEVSQTNEIPPVLLVTSKLDRTSKGLTPNNLIGLLTSYDYLDMYAHSISKYI